MLISLDQTKLAMRLPLDRLKICIIEALIKVMFVAVKAFWGHILQNM